MKLCALVVLLAHFSLVVVAQNLVSSGPYYEYDTNRNGWYIGSPSHPISVSLNRPQNNDVPSIYRGFVNRTLARQSSGVCQKEVP